MKLEIIDRIVRFMSEKTKEIFKRALADLEGLLNENEEQIEASIAKGAEESQLHEKGLVFKIACGISLDFEKDKLTAEISWSDKHRRTAETSIPDPDQLKLGGVE